MNDLRLNRKDGAFITACLLILVFGVLVSLRYFKSAFPEATIEFHYDRAQSGDIAQKFADGMGWDVVHDYRHAGRFGYDNQAKTYLEKELGVDGARRYLGKPVRLWYWQHRWFRAGEKEEYQVYVTPEGEIVNLKHEIPENAPGADLAEDSARTIAERFLFGVMKQDSTKLTFIESQRIGRPERADWSFTYRATGIEPVKGAEYRYAVGLIGDQIGSYREWLKVPEEWSASYSKLRSLNDAASNVDGIGLLLTVFAIIAVFVIRSRRKDIRWTIAMKFGMVAVALVALNRINDFPQSLFWYQTEDAWSGFLTREVLSSLIAAIGAGAMIFLLTAASEPLYREQHPNKLSLTRMFTAHGLRTKRAFKNILLGVTLTSFFFAYQIVFYLVAAKFGAWSPSDVPYDNLLNTAMPWLAVLAVGFFPAVSEEFMSRMFSIPFLQKIFKNRMVWLTLLLPAMIWGFGHAGYPNQPWWIRGMEVGIAGVLIGFVMLKWGILATLVWHYTVDALYTAFLLFRSENPYYVFTAAVATGLLVIPLLIAIIAYLRKGAFLPEEGALNTDDTTSIPEPVMAALPVAHQPKVEATTYRRLPARSRWIGLGLLGAGIIALMIPVERIGDFLSFPVTKSDAVRIFSDSLRASGWANPDTLKVAAFVNEDDDFMDADDPLVYLLKHSHSIYEFNHLADERLGIGRWRVLAWQPENRLRFTGSVHARTGAIESFAALLPEEMPGDSMLKDSAQVLVERTLAAQGEDTTALVLKEYKDFARPHRLDHSFTYEAKEGDSRHLAEAKYRRGGMISGNRLAVGKRPWYKLPEEWERARKATTVPRTIREWLSILAMTGAFVWMLVLVGIRARQGRVPWKKVFVAAIFPAVIAIIAQTNLFYLQQHEYFNRVEISWAVFRTTLITTWLISGALMFALFSLGFAFLSGLYPDHLELMRRHERRAAALDAWLALAAGAGTMLLSRSIHAWLGALEPGWIHFTGWQLPGWLAAPMPLPMMVDTLLRDALLVAALLAFFAYHWTKTMHVWWQKALLALGAVFLLMGIAQGDPGEWLMDALFAIVVGGLGWFVLQFMVAGRPLNLFTLAIGAMGTSTVLGSLGTGNGTVILHTWALIILTMAVFALWVAPVWRGRPLPVD